MRITVLRSSSGCPKPMLADTVGRTSWESPANCEGNRPTQPFAYPTFRALSASCLLATTSGSGLTDESA